MATACSIRVRGVVQGVGFRPFVYRLAQANMLTGWVLNGDRGVEIHLEGAEEDLATFVREIKAKPPAAAQIAEIEVEPAPCEGFGDFTIRESERLDRPTVRVSPDLPVCDECLAELFDPSDHRYRYAYINCTNCGPRYSVILALPYDRPNTTMRRWPHGPLLQGPVSRPRQSTLSCAARRLPSLRPGVCAQRWPAGRCRRRRGH